MRTLEELRERLLNYGDAEYIHQPETGCIAWHFSTGDNIEVLFLESAVPGSGGGGMMFRAMAEHLLRLGRLPYHSVFAFRLTSNEQARRFYERFGWTQVDLGWSIYEGDETTIMWIAWKDLLRRLRIEERNDETNYR